MTEPIKLTLGGRLNNRGHTLEDAFANLATAKEPVKTPAVAQPSVAVVHGSSTKTGPAAPHQLRHACATHMLDNGAPLVVIQKILGHEKLSTTALYAFVSPKLMQRTYNDAHPSARVA